MSEAGQVKAVFLSYASQDAEAALRLCSGLRAAGIEVWFDQNELVGGDAWDAKIRKQIRDCALFVPVISANTEARLEGYFRLEWKLAEDRSHLMAKGKPFIVPVTIDTTTERDAHVPDAFVAVQWTRLRQGYGGQALNEASVAAFCERVRSLLGIGVAQASPPADRAEAGGTPALPRRRAPLGAAGLTIVVVALIGVGAWKWLPRQGAAESSGDLRQDAAATQNKPGALAISDKSLVVLPLENLSPDPENAFFTDGVHAEIIATLSRVPDLKVISRNSALAFKGSPTPLAEIARRLGVANVITGSVRREKEKVRIQIELRRAGDEALLWSSPPRDRDLEDVWSLQSEIAEEVARVLQAREAKGTYGGARFMTKSIQAYDLFIKASKEDDVAEQTLGMAEKTIRALEEILKLDRNFMPACSRLSTTHIRAFNRSTDPAARVRHAAEAKRWAEVASRLVPGGAGDGALAYYYTNVERDYGRALALAENQINAAPNEAMGHNVAAIACNGLGRTSEALIRYDRALALDPLNPVFWNNKLITLVRLRRGDEANETITRLIGLRADAPARNGLSIKRFALSGELPAEDELVQDMVWLWRSGRFLAVIAKAEESLSQAQTTELDRFSLHCWQADALRRVGRADAARDAARAALASAEKLQQLPEIDRSESDGRMARALARIGRTGEAFAAARNFVGAASPSNQQLLRWRREVAFAELFAYLDRPRECVELLALLLRVPSGLTVPMLRVDPVWDNVREDAGFKALLADPKNSAPL